MLKSGDKLGPYEVSSLIGAGGMGEVYRAHDSRLGREVAIKVLPEALALDADRLRRFEQEARAVAALNHPNLLTVYDVGVMPPPIDKGSSTESRAGTNSSATGTAVVAAGSPYIVSELLEGASLRERISASALPARKAIDYAIQIARGLAAAHERGIVHRDLKPENIFVTDDGRAKILDFGLAKLTQPANSDPDATMQSGTQAGIVLGTLGYMSPEQVRGKLADPRSDVFSFGAVLYEMLSGRRAFQGETAADVLSAILKEEPPELSETRRDIPPALERIVRHCLEKNPQERFQSAHDLAFQLSEISGLGSSSGSGAIRALAAPAPGANQRRLLFAAGGTLGLIAAVCITWLAARATYRHAPPKFTQMSFQQGAVGSARFLPDGQSFVCAARWGTDAKFALYTGRSDSQGLRPLGVQADSIASVSPSGELLVIQNLAPVGPGYVATGTLARVPLGGGAPRPLLDSRVGPRRP